jgi:DNA-binding GntR family transcriptional regulator
VGPLKVGLSLKERVAQQITDAILTGKIRPGERLNESQLARELEVSRAPVREALQHLNEQALIVNIPRRGMFVVSLEHEEIQKITSLRMILEAEALRLVRQNLTPQIERRLGQLIDTMDAMQPTPTGQASRVDLEFHRAIWAASGNEYLERTLTSLTAALFAHSALTLLRQDKIRMVLDSHRPLFDFICGRLDTSAEDVMVAHLALRYPDPVRFSSLAKQLTSA